MANNGGDRGVPLDDPAEQLRRVLAAQQRLLASERFAAIGETMTALAHESRNALQRIQSCLTLLQLQPQSSESRALIDDMQDAQDQLQRLFDEVNNFAAPMPLRLQAIELTGLLEKTWSDLEPGWEQKQLSFACADSSGGARVRADPAHLSRAFRKLLENAIEASVPGGRIRAALAPSRVGGQPAVQIGIEDLGAGITPALQGRVFDLLFTTKEGGTGMGLAIARRIVHEHGGDIRLDSAVGEGTTVTVRLPRRAAGEPFGRRADGREDAVL